MLKKFFKQKGQALVFFAIALPTLFMFVAVVVEFGWWYINQSRLQNAADAAVLAGAEKIVSSVENKASNISFKVDFVNKVPPGYSASQAETAGDEVAKVAKPYADKNFYYSATEPDYAAYYNSFKHYTYGDTKKFNPAYYAVELEGKAKHLFSIMNNFGEMNLKAVAVARITENIDGVLENLKVQNVITGNWEIQNLYQGLTYEADEYGTPIRDKDDFIKYKNAANYAYAKGLTTEAALNSALKAFQDASGLNFLFTGKWNHYKEKDKIIYYHNGDEFRHEVVDVYVTQTLEGKKYHKYDPQNTQKTNEEYADQVEGASIIEYGSAFATPANKSGEISDGDIKLVIKNAHQGNQYSWKNVTSINLDWAQDFNINLKNLKSGNNYYSVSDWDIGYKLPPDIESISPYSQATKSQTINGVEVSDGWDSGKLNYRIHGLITFYEAFPWIAEKDDKGNVKNVQYYNPLWARIESEPMWSFLGPTKRQSGVDSVHQIIININDSNWMDEDGNGHPVPIDAPAKYNTTEKIIYRPIVFFYDGPETNSENIFLDQAHKYDPPYEAINYNGATRPNTRYPTRASLPVILNLNADFAGILYMPNSPVCVITNGHRFKGFIRAKSYKILDSNGTEISHPTKNVNGDRLKSLDLYIKTVTDYNPSAQENDPSYVKEVHGEVQFKDTTVEQVKSSLAAGSEYSIFNIASLKDTFFDTDNTYTADSESGDIIMTVGD